MCERTTDKALVGRFLKGDQHAFAQLVRRYENFCFRIAYGVVRNDADASDCVQNTLLGMSASLADFDWSMSKDGTIKGWLGTSVKNHARGVLRTKRNRSTPQAMPNGYDTPANAGHSERDLAERVNIVNMAMQKLSDDDRTILQLRFWGQLSYKGIGDVLKLSPEAVNTRLRRARCRLKDILGANGSGSFGIHERSD